MHHAWTGSAQYFVHAANILYDLKEKCSGRCPLLHSKLPSQCEYFSNLGMTSTFKTKAPEARVPNRAITKASSTTPTRSVCNPVSKGAEKMLVFVNGSPDFDIIDHYGVDGLLQAPTSLQIRVPEIEDWSDR